MKKSLLHTKKGHIAAAITALIWGTTFISTKLLLQVFLPIEILFLRFLIGFIALSILHPAPIGFLGKKREFLFAIGGLCGITLYYLLENIALTYTLASNAGIILSVNPFFVALLAKFITKDEVLTPYFFPGFFVSTAGIICISFAGQSSLEINPFGDFLALMAAVVWAIYAIISRKIGKLGYDTIATTRKTFGYGLLFMIPALFIFDFHIEPLDFFSPAIIFNILFLSLGASALCFATWNIAVTNLGTVQTSIYLYTVPVITVITSVLILKEPLSFLTVLGTCLSILGLIISNYKRPVSS